MGDINAHNPSFFPSPLPQYLTKEEAPLLRHRCHGGWVGHVQLRGI